MPKHLFENENITEVKNEINEILDLTNGLSKSQQRELLAFVRGYKYGLDKSAAIEEST